MEYKQYRRKGFAEMRPYANRESMEGISIAMPDRANGSPKEGDMIARNPQNHADKWLVSAKFFEDNYEPVQ
jgi:hypothetical protein